MPSCCKSRGPNLVLYRFPEEMRYPIINRPAVKRQREAWLKAIGWEELINEKDPPTLFVCADHFKGSKYLIVF